MYILKSLRTNATINLYCDSILSKGIVYDREPNVSLDFYHLRYTISLA